VEPDRTDAAVAHGFWRGLVACLFRHKKRGLSVRLVSGLLILLIGNLFVCQQSRCHLNLVLMKMALDPQDVNRPIFSCARDDSPDDMRFPGNDAHSFKPFAAFKPLLNRSA
jgi:hypothetical protein